MKSIFNQAIRNEVVARIELLTEHSKPLWGKMTVGQMVRHCALCEDYYFGNIQVKRSFLGRIVGQSAIKSILKNETSGIGRNAPTSAKFQVNEKISDLGTEKDAWIVLIERYATFEKAYFTHWFFGKMTKTQLGEFIYKHCDHHLKQFAV